MTNSEKIDFLYSKFVSPNDSQTSVFNKQIWAQGNDIPSTIPLFDSNGEYKNSFGDVILKKNEYIKMTMIPGFHDAFSSTSVYDVVSYENGFDQSYEYKFYTRSSNGSYIEIPFGEGGYFFDHDTGILFFPEGRTALYNPSSLYVTFIQYVGRKGINTTSQFSGYPQPGPIGPTGPIGQTGDTGPIDPFSLKYKSTWSSSLQYSKWDIVKYDGKFFISTINSNTYTPTNGAYWQPFGVPQLSTNFDYPNNTYWVSPGFTNTGNRFNNLEGVFSDILSNVLTDVTLVVYPGDYTVNNLLLLRSNVNLNVIFYGRVNITFRDDTIGLLFTRNNRVEFRGNDYAFTNGFVWCVNSSLSTTGGSLSNVRLGTLDLQNTGRLLAVDSEIQSIQCYTSFVNLIGTDVIKDVTMDEASVVHLDSCVMQARPIDDVDQYKIRIVSCASVGSIPGFGYENPALLIKNCRILSNGPVLYSTMAPQYGMQIGLIASSLYVTDSSTSFLDFSDSMDAFVFDTVVNTAYDDTKLRILNINGQFQTIDANFED